jgi:hypothetical protein
LLNTGVEKFFELDGIGGLLGIPPVDNRGAPVEILKELTKYYAADGVHYTELGYANIVRTVVAAIKGISSGQLTK